MKHRPLWWILLLIAGITVISGAVQAVVPGVLLRLLHSQDDPTARHFFGIVGMFMVLFGGLFLHALLSRVPQPAAVLWASFQKIGAFGAVALGVLHHLFAPMALAVAGFDLLSGILGLAYWCAMRRMPPA